MDDVERGVGVGQRQPIGDVDLQPGRGGDARILDDGRGEDLRAAVDRRDADGAPPSGGLVQPGERQIGAARPDIEDRQRVAARGEVVDGPLGGTDATPAPVDAGEIAQIPGDRRVVRERSVEELIHID